MGFSRCLCVGDAFYLFGIFESVIGARVPTTGHACSWSALRRYVGRPATEAGAGQASTAANEVQASIQACSGVGSIGRRSARCGSNSSGLARMDPPTG